MLLLAFLANALNAFQGTVYTTSMVTAGIMRTTVAGAIASIALNAVLVPALGLHGACLTMLGGNLLVFALRAFGTRSLIAFDMRWSRFAATGLLLCLQAAVIALQLPGYMAVSLALFVVVFAFEFWWLWEVISTIFGSFAVKICCSHT